MPMMKASRQMKKGPYRKGKWFQLGPAFYRKNWKTQEVFDDQITITIKHPFHEDQERFVDRDGTEHPLPCEILRDVVRAWDNGLSKDFVQIGYLVENQEGNQPLFRLKIGENDYQEFTQAADEGAADAKQPQVIEEAPPVKESKRKNPFAR